MPQLRRFLWQPFFFSALGVIAGHFLSERTALSAHDSQTLSARTIELTDAAGRKRVVIATSQEGSPAMWFFDDKGKARLNLGLYPDGDAMVVLNDTQERAVEIVRTVGASPVLVQKTGGADRLILGLNAAGAPYLVTMPPAGPSARVFGTP